MSAPSLLVELFTEELPPKALQDLGLAFATGVLDGLRVQGLATSASTVESFATPRRLAARVSAVLPTAPDRAESKKLMPVSVAYGANGEPAPALQKRLDKENATVGQLTRKTEGIAEYVFLDRAIAGVSLAAGLQAVLSETIARLPVPKLMSYQLADGETTVQFVRPAHGLIALHGDKVVDVSVLGLKAGRLTHGHRFQGVQEISIAAAGAYEEALAAHGKVIASFELRRDEILHQLREAAAKLKLSLGADDDVSRLLDEVTALTENPAVYAGEFDAEFLSVPQECLILSMRSNQKYFPLFDAKGSLSNRFLIVSNMRLADPRHVIEGNQRVMRPRLADARFFFETDRNTKLADRVPLLARVTYHYKLGTQLERTQRIDLLSREIARTLGRGGVEAPPEDIAGRAAYLAKADLLTNMVGEFPELQGTMGRYYALHDGEEAVVAQAIEEHYWPRFAGDGLPQSTTGAIVALADKLDTLVAMFGIGNLPSGDKDPFGLRRAALGALRILIELRLPLSSQFLLDAAASGLYGKINQGTQKMVLEFLLDRLRGYLRDRREQGYNSNEIEAVLAGHPQYLNHEILAKLSAVRSFLALPEAESLAAANKRVLNIINKNEEIRHQFRDPDRTLMKESAELALMDAVDVLSPVAEERFKTGDYEGSLRLLADLKPSVDRFFDEVMVMVDDQKIRNNRAALLQRVGTLMNQVADISKLAA